MSNKAMKELESMLDFGSEKEIKILSKFLKSLRKFRGISVTLLKIQLNSWDGYGFYFLSIKKYVGGTCSSRALIFMNVYVEHSCGGIEVRIMAGIFFLYWKVWSKIIVPKKDRCEQCDDLCETKEFYVGDVPYCSEGCRDW